MSYFRDFYRNTPPNLLGTFSASLPLIICFSLRRVISAATLAELGDRPASVAAWRGFGSLAATSSPTTLEASPNATNCSPCCCFQVHCWGKGWVETSSTPL